MNANIAPMKKLGIKQRIEEIERFLKEQEEKIVEPLPPERVEEPIPSIIPPRIVEPRPPRIPPITEEPVPEPPSENEAITLLKKITENQEIDRKRWERRNAIEGDEEIYDFNEASVPPGYIVEFYLDVPEGWVYFINYINITYAADTDYNIWIDNIWEPTLTDSILDFGNHQSYYIPPRKCYTQAKITALNNGLITQTYNVFFGGFLRRYRAIGREITYESLQKEKQET